MDPKKNCPFCGGNQAVYEIEQRMVDLERESERLIARAEHREGQITNILRELGSDAEWSSMCDLGDHGIEVAAAMVGEVERLREWKRLADAAPADAQSVIEARRMAGDLLGPAVEAWRQHAAELESKIIRLTHERDEARDRYASLEDEVTDLRRQVADLRGGRVRE